MVALSADYLRCSLITLFFGSHAIFCKGGYQRHAVMMKMCYLRGHGLAGKAKFKAHSGPRSGTTFLLHFTQGQEYGY